MIKKPEENIAKESVMSIEMLRSLKQSISMKKDFDEFLISVKAKKADKYMGANILVVNEFPNADIHKYQEQFIKKHEHSINDTFVFEKYAKRTRWKNEERREEPTGWFSPILFWNWVHKQKV